MSWTNFITPAIVSAATGIPTYLLARKFGAGKGLAAALGIGVGGASGAGTYWFQERGRERAKEERLRTERRESERKRKEEEARQEPVHARLSPKSKITSDEVKAYVAALPPKARKAFENNVAEKLENGWDPDNITLGAVSESLRVHAYLDVLSDLHMLPSTGKVQYAFRAGNYRDLDILDDTIIEHLERHSRYLQNYFRAHGTLEGARKFRTKFGAVGIDPEAVNRDIRSNLINWGGEKRKHKIYVDGDRVYKWVKGEKSPQDVGPAPDLIKATMNAADRVASNNGNVVSNIG